MSKLHMAAAKATILASALLSASAFAVAPTNPGFEDVPDLDTWTVADIGDYSGGGDVVRGGDATEGDAYGRVSFWVDYAFGETALGPALQSAVFSAYAGEQLSLDWRLIGQGACNGNLGGGDVGLALGFLMEAGTDAIAETFIDTGPTCLLDTWQTSIATAPAAGDYYLLLQIGSYDATGGGVIGAELHVDNIFSINQPPDCTEAVAGPGRLWPPSHRLYEIEILGVTDPDGDAFEIVVDSVWQDEPTNSYDDGDTCPDAIIGTDTARVRAERVGGEWSFEGDGRVYRINFTATDELGASCVGYVKVGVPHDKKQTPHDLGPLFDSTLCP